MKDDELDLWKRYGQGDEDARETLILNYLYLVKIQVLRISKKVFWASREDLMQEGVKGLIAALEKYNPESGNEFAAYARKFIRGAVFRNPEVIRDLTRYQYENHRKVKDIHDALMREWGRKPNIDEIVERSGLTADQVINALNASSIAFAQGFTDYDMESTVSQSAVEIEEERILIREAFSLLSKQTGLILVEHYWNGLSDREIAEKFEMKVDTVKKCRQRAINKLRTLLEAERGSEHNES
jgi:RNA polymerase sigma factor (sigma-70 family)